MKLFFAAASNDKDMAGLDRAENNDLLFSYHYYNEKKKKLYALFKDKLENPDNTIFLDSGAYSAWTMGKPINLDEYMKFIRKTKPTYYAVLDDIQNPDKTIINQKIMESEGLNPVPVFHMGENIKFLYQYCDQYDFMALGGMVGSRGIQDWLDSVWTEILKINPEMKIHGFGMTNVKLMKRYPFWSCDSSSWASSVRFAQVNLWNPHRNKLYDVEVWKWARNNDIEYERGEKITGEFRNQVIAANCDAFMQLRDHVTEYHAKSDFSHLKNQLSIFN